MSWGEAFVYSDGGWRNAEEKGLTEKEGTQWRGGRKDQKPTRTRRSGTAPCFFRRGGLMKKRPAVLRIAESKGKKNQYVPTVLWTGRAIW